MRFNMWFYLVVFLLGLSQSLSSQVITGKVMDYYSKDGLIAADVKVYKNNININSTKTNFYGDFEIDTKEGDEIRVSYIGYQPVRISGINLTELEIFLKEEGEIIICNYPIIIEAQKYKTLTNYSEISKTEIESLPSQSPQNLYNNIPGLYMHAGALNTNRITIRGIGSRSPFSTTKIKAYLNDIPLTNGIGETNLEDLNLGIIDNINIYKGPSASRHGASLGGLIHYRTVFDNDSGNTFNSDISYGSFNTISWVTIPGLNFSN